MSIVWIYYLTDKNEKYFYVGKTNNPERRLRDHYLEAKKGVCRRSRWIREVGTIFMNEIEEVAESTWSEAEKHWIAKFREKFGWDRVLNETDGGDSPPILRGEEKPNSRLTWEDIYYIRSCGKGQTELAIEFQCSQKKIYNIIHNKAWSDPDYTPNPKKNHGGSRLTEGDIINIRLSGLSPKELTEIYGHSAKSIRRILRNERWYDEDWDPINRVYIN